MNTTKNTQEIMLQLTHEVNAPRQLVFDAFSTAEALNEWWGPVEYKNSVIKLDFRPGGIFHFKMDDHGTITYARMLFGKIESPGLLEFNTAFTDENANVVKPKFDFEFPYEVFYRLVFTEKNGKTIIHLTGQPVNATEEQMNGYRAIFESMEKGWGGTFNALDKYVNR